MEKLWKIFKLPSPRELGWTHIKYNALPMRSFTHSSDKHTWEDWEELMKKEYPIRYFLAETLPVIFSRILRYLKNIVYWIACHTLPSFKYHYLDLRQPGNKEYGIDPYKYGWIDSDSQILYAIFNIFNSFMKKEGPYWYCPSEEDVQKEPYLLDQRNIWLEAKAIHYWWNVERLRQHKKCEDELLLWHEARKKGDVTKISSSTLFKLEKERDDKEDEMLVRLLKIRRYLWT